MKKLSFFLMAMLISVMSFADTYTHTFKSGELKVGTVTLSGVSWTGAGTVEYWGWDGNNAKGIQIGSGSKPCKAYSLTTSGFEGKITEVVVNTSMASGGTAKLSISVGGTSYLSNQSLTTTATNYTATGEASGDLVISYTNTAKAFYIKSISVTYVVEENPDATKYTVTANVNDPAMGKVTGAGEYEEGKTATLTAVPNPAFKFVSWSNGSTDNPLKFTVTEDVELTATFEALPTMTCAEASAAASGATVVLNPFDVVAVVKGAGYIYIQDESGVALIFDYTMDDQLKAGDHVEGFVGVSSPYNGLPELKPSVAFADLTVTPGTAPEPTLFTEVPTKADLNKYVKFENVTLTANATFTTESATNATMVVNGTNVTLRNTFKLAATLSKDKTYDIVGFVAVYNSNIQVYFLSAEEYVAPVVNHTVTVTATAEGENVVSGGGEYEDGEEVTVTASEDLEGWVFIGWTEDGEFVANDPEYTFDVKGDVELVAVYAADLGEKEVTDLVIDGENQLLTGSVADFPMGTMNLELALGEYNEEEGTFLLTEESKLYVGETNFTFFDGMAAVDMDTNSAMAIVVFEYNGAYYHMTVNMSAAAAEPIVVVVENATLDDQVESTGFFYMAGECTIDGVIYPVKAEIPGFDKTKAEAEYENVMVEVGTWEGEYVGNATGTATVSVVDNVVTLTGVIENPMTHVAFDVTISGTLPVKEEPALKGVVKRAVQLGESVVVLTHEADGTARIYNVVGENISEVSLEGVVPVDPEDEFDYLAISDIAVTEDGKLVATNYTRCNFGSTTYGTSYFYLWNDLDADPTIWFQSNASSNSTYSDQGYTMAVKGTSTNAVVMTTGVHNTKRGVRMSQYTVIDGVYEDINNAGGFKTSEYYFLFGLTDNVVFNENNSGTNLELNALGENWVMDGNLIEPTEWAVPATMSENHIVKGVIAEGTLGKKYNGATYVTVGNQVLMVAPYADAEGKLAGVKILDVTAGFAAATEVAVADLDAAVEATAAATAVAVAENTLTITLVGDATLYTLTAELTQDPGPGTALENIAVEGKAVKAIVNGQLIIIKNGVQYNAQGQVIK